MKRLQLGLILAVGALALSSCGTLGIGKGKPKTPVLGNRVSILTSESGIEVDPAIADVGVLVPDAIPNADWPQPGGNGAKAMQHVALGTSIGPAWSVKIQGTSNIERLAASPVVADGKIFVMDTFAKLAVFSAKTGAPLWSAQVSNGKDAQGGKSFVTGYTLGNRLALFGGGVSYDDGKVFATNGIGDVYAFDASTGAKLWNKRPGGPLRGAPSIGLGNIYVMSQDNQIFALAESDGASVWNGSGSLELAGVFGVGAPAIAQGTVVAGFSSGELNAYRYENGRSLWGDALSRTSISTSVAALADVDASPVIDQGRVFAIGQGGRMVSMELVTGQRLWEINVAGISTPWVVGEWVFVVDDEARLLCLARSTGKVRWISQLQRYHKNKAKNAPVTWTGPILAGGRLILASSEGLLANVDPANGRIQSTVKGGSSFYLPPIVADNMLYTLANDGRLTGWR